MAKKLAESCQSHHIQRLLRMAHLERELSHVLGGWKVALRTSKDLSRYFRDEVLREAQVQYARG